MKFIPVLDKGFAPLSVVLRDFRAEVAKSNKKPLKICVERNDGYNYIYNIDVF